MQLIGLAVVRFVLIEQRVEVIGDARDEGIARLGIRLPGLEERGQLYPVRRKAIRHQLSADAIGYAVIVEQCHDNGCHMPWNGRQGDGSRQAVIAVTLAPRARRVLHRYNLPILPRKKGIVPILFDRSRGRCRG